MDAIGRAGEQAAALEDVYRKQAADRQAAVDVAVAVKSLSGDFKIISTSAREHCDCEREHCHANERCNLKADFLIEAYGIRQHVCRVCWSNGLNAHVKRWKEDVMDKQYTLVQFTQVERGRGIRRTRPCWVSGVKFADGPGMKAKSISYTADISKASRFSLASAFDIAAQFYKFPAALVRPDGTVLVDDTRKLLEEQQKRCASHVQARNDFEATLREMFPPELLAQLRKALR